MTDSIEKTDSGKGGAVRPSDNKPVEAYLDGGIFYRHWQAEHPVRAVILLAHGLGEHSGRYHAFAEYFTARGISVVAPDHIGHGVSPGHRSHIVAFDDYLQPLAEMRDLIALWYPGLPCFLIGHSMGGLIAARFLLEHQGRFTGAALSGAALQAAEPPSAFSMFLARLFSRCIPKMGLLQLDATQISRDPAVVREYQDDPLVHKGKSSARLIVEIFKNMELVERDREKIILPIFVMHGEEDAMTTSAGSEVFYHAVKSRKKELKIYAGLYHEIFNEPERLEVMGDLAAWLDTIIQDSSENT